MSDDLSKVFFASAADRAKGRGRAYRVIPQSRMRELRIAYRQRRQPIDRTDPDRVRFEMTPMFHARAIETVMPTGERIRKVYAP